MGAILSSGDIAVTVILSLLNAAYLAFECIQLASHGKDNRLLLACAFASFCFLLSSILLGVVGPLFGYNLGVAIVAFFAQIPTGVGLVFAHEKLSSGYNGAIKASTYLLVVCLIVGMFPIIIGVGAGSLAGIQATFVMLLITHLFFVAHTGVRAFHYQQTFSDRKWHAQVQVFLVLLGVAFFVSFAVECAWVSRVFDPFASTNFQAIIFFTFFSWSAVPLVLAMFAPLLDQVAEDIKASGGSGSAEAPPPTDPAQPKAPEEPPVAEVVTDLEKA